MARSTFEGPILAGTNRFPPFRNVGSVDLAQNGQLTFTNSNSGTPGFAGASTVPVTGGQTYPNTPAIVYTPNSANTTLTPASTTADSSSVYYRVFVMYVPAGSTIVDYVADIVIPTIASGTISSVQVSLSNQFAYNGAFGATYALSSATAVTGRNTWNTLTATQITNSLSTSTDIVLPNGQFNVSQIVWTIAINGSSLSGALTAGSVSLTLRYIQADSNIGSATAYPYGNFD